MALVQLVTGTSTTATTTVSFTAQAAGTLLVLIVGADDYRATSGTGRPESTGWTLPTGAAQQTNLGHYMWYKLTDGSETSVQYKINSASGSVYWLGYFTESIDQTTPLDASNGNFEQFGGFTHAFPSVSTTAGDRVAVAAAGAAQNPLGVTGTTDWTNSYTQVGFNRNLNGGGTGDAIGIAYLAFTGGAATTTTVTYQGANPDAATGILAVFKVAAGGSSVSATPADALGLTDTAAPVADRGRSVADLLGLSDAPTGAALRPRTATDALGLSDSVTVDRSASGAASPADPLGLTDAVTVAWARAANISDALALTDPGQSSDIATSHNDPLDMTDAVTATRSGASAFSPDDPLGLTDAASSALARPRTPADQLGFSDEAASTAVRPHTIADNASLTDQVSVERTAAGEETPDDTLGLTDTVTVAWTRVRTVDDFLALTDAAGSTTANEASKSATDPLPLTDTTTWTTSRARPLDDTVGLSDTAVAVLDHVETATDTVGLTDTVVAVRTNPDAFVDVRVVNITEHPRPLTTTEHPRQVTIRDRST